MIILTIRTDKPEAEIGLYDDQNQLVYEKWQAHRQLAETIHQKIQNLVNLQSKSLQQIEGIVVFKGPGSFTGLRIGLSVVNALAYGLGVPIVSTSGKSWETTGIKKLLAGKNENVALPEYGQEPHITKPKK